MARQGVKGKIVFVSSVLAFFSIVGYSTYSPGKFAIRGDALVHTSPVVVAQLFIKVSRKLFKAN